MVSSQSRTRWCWKRIRVDSRATSGKWRCGQKKFYGVCRTPLWGELINQVKLFSSWFSLNVKYVILLLWEYEREGKREGSKGRERGVREGRREEKERTRAPEFWVETLFLVLYLILSIRVNEKVGFLSFSCWSFPHSCLVWGRKPPSGLLNPLAVLFLAKLILPVSFLELPVTFRSL